jgi:hypothetical protein
MSKIIFTIALMIVSTAIADIGNPEHSNIKSSKRSSNGSLSSSSKANLKATHPSGESIISSTWSWMKPRLSLGAYFVSANTFKGSFSSSANSGSVELNSNSGIGFHAQISERQKWNSWGYFSGLSYESEKTITTLQLNSKNVSGTGQIDTKMKTFILSGGAHYSVTDRIFFPMGLNLPIFTQTSKGLLDKFEMSPQIGFQAGVGFLVKENILAELLWRRLVFSGKAGNSGDEIEIQNLRLEGINVQASYRF